MKSIKLRVCRIGDAKFILDIYNFATKSGFFLSKKIFSTIKKSNKRSEKCFLNNQFIKIKKNKKKASTKINLKNVNYFEYKFN